MDWIQSLSKAIRHVEDNLTDDLSVDEVARQAYASGAHFQFVFHVVTGMTIGEYIRNRRLSRAAQDLLQAGAKVADVAARYRYETPESFSKAFTRFHGVSPSRLQRGQARLFHPLKIRIAIEGGFDMSQSFVEAFHLLDWTEIDAQPASSPTAAEKYHRLVTWAGEARGRNPEVFDALTDWIRDDAQWRDDTLAENGQILMQGVLARFREQNARLRSYLRALEPSGVVNPAVFVALDRFDRELSGQAHEPSLREPVARVFADFSAMRERGVREKIAGNRTGPTGTNTVDLFGYINCLKDDDAQVQWALFMPDMVKAQQQGFQVESFHYRRLPAMRFIGREGPQLESPEARKALFDTLDALRDDQSDFPHDLLFMHHDGMGVDVGPWHGLWGRFMKADAPVPEGFLHFDFVTEPDDKAGPPYVSQFAFATFSGDIDAMHRREGYDCDAMYDVTRNILLGQGICIPYPGKYWTAEVFLDGFDKPGTAYLFGVLL